MISKYWEDIDHGENKAANVCGAQLCTHLYERIWDRGKKIHRCEPLCRKQGLQKGIRRSGFQSGACGYAKFRKVICIGRLEIFGVPCYNHGTPKIQAALIRRSKRMQSKQNNKDYIAECFYGHNISLRKLPQALMLQILNSAKYFHFRVIWAINFNSTSDM